MSMTPRALPSREIIASLKQPNNGSGLNFKDKQKLAYKESKLKLVMPQLGDLKVKQTESERTNQKLLDSK